MTRLLEWLLDLDHIRLGRDAPLSLAWRAPIPGWLLATIALLGVGVVVLLYRRESGSVARRAVPACLRVGVLAVLLAVVCRPTLVLQRNRIDRASVIILLDESRSMARTDRYVDASRADDVMKAAGLSNTERLASTSRLDIARGALLARGAAPLKALLKKNAVEVYSFAGSARREARAGSPVDLPALSAALNGGVPDGAETDIGSALAQVLDGGRRLAGVVLISDGGATAPIDLVALSERAAARGVGIITVPIGSPAPVRDLRVGPLRAEDAVFVNDPLAITAPVEAIGITQPVSVTVRLVDERSGLTVSRRPLTLVPGAGAASVELHARPAQPGTVRYRVEVSPLEDERTTRNNARTIEVHVLDDRLNVLFVDGTPRYEYRYLKNALAREPSMRLSVLLLDADERFVQEGTQPIRRFPRTAEELETYDVVLFGDVDPLAGWLSAEQMRLLVRFVGDHGGGFGLIAGERYAPQRFRGTPLEKLIPIRIDPGASGRAGGTGSSSGFGIRLTDDGVESRIFRIEEDAPRSRARFESLPPLYWSARILGPRPGATVLARRADVQTPDGEGMPIVVVGRYGAGKLFFQGTDDTWRWRRTSGEFLHDTYWVRVVRELSRPQRVGRDPRLFVRTDRRGYALGAPVRTLVRVVDSQLLAELGPRVHVIMRDERDVPVRRFEADRLGESADTFEGTSIPPATGGFTLTVEDVAPKLGDEPARARIDVVATAPESRRVATDARMLERIAVAGGGRAAALGELDAVLSAIPDRSVQTPDDVVEPLWDSKLALIVFGLLITAEWVTRKALGML